MRQHLVVDVFVAFSGLDDAVEHQDPAEVRVFEDHQILMSCLLAMEDAISA